MTDDDSLLARLEDWVFEEEDRFLLTYSRAILCLFSLIALFSVAVIGLVRFVDYVGPWPPILLGAYALASWAHWTIFGGKS